MNESGQEVQIEEVSLTQLHYPMDTPFWAEGYNMLSMYGGTLAEPRLTGTVSDGITTVCPRQKARSLFITCFS